VAEEAGLVGTRAVAVIHDPSSGPTDDPGRVFLTSRGRVCIKYTFIMREERGAPVGGSGAEPEVRLDPNEHSDMAWATEEEVHSGMLTGDRTVELTFTHEDQRRIIIEAFRMLKGGQEQHRQQHPAAMWSFFVKMPTFRELRDARHTTRNPAVPAPKTWFGLDLRTVVLVVLAVIAILNIIGIVTTAGFLFNPFVWILLIVEIINLIANIVAFWAVFRLIP
ncbi:hypothetical protein HK405_002652, partial [Cladochytrium tenue]